MPEPLRHYGWWVSPYSAKTRAYLTFKQVEFRDVAPSARLLGWTIRRAVGRAIMPTVRMPDGRWLQDSSEIVDTLEGELTGPSITPSGPTQRLASALLELHGDEWWPTVAMHTRWNLGANEAFAVEEFGRYGFPWLPTWLSMRLVQPIAGRMSGYRPVLGVQSETLSGIEAFLRETVSTLDTHLKEMPFLLGTRPCLGDFALYGPLWSHVYRDPASRHYFDDAPAVVAWFDRLASPTGEPGEFLANDAVPSTLDPLFKTLFAEQMVFVASLMDAVDRWCAENPDAERVPRSLGPAPFVIGGCSGTRTWVTFTQWMAQRPLEVYGAIEAADKVGVDAWLMRVGGHDAMQRQVGNRFERRGFKMRLAAGL
jgi:glutathione S-transferase